MEIALGAAGLIIFVIIPVLTLVASSWAIRNWGRLRERFRKFFKLFLLYSFLSFLPLVLMLLNYLIFKSELLGWFLLYFVPFWIIWLVESGVFLSIFFRKVIIRKIKQEEIVYELENSTANWIFIFPLILLIGLYLYFFVFLTPILFNRPPS